MVSQRRVARHRTLQPPLDELFDGPDYRRRSQGAGETVEIGPPPLDARQRRGLRVLLHEQQGAGTAREAAPAGAARKVDHRGVVTGAAVLNPAPPSPSQSL